MYDAVIATIGVLIVDNGLPDTSSFDKHTFYTVVTITAFGATLARLLYQRALSIAPLSLTVPYLAFTPAFVVLISPLFLVGESASPMGMLGEHTAVAAAAATAELAALRYFWGLGVLLFPTPSPTCLLWQQVLQAEVWSADMCCALGVYKCR